MSATPEIAYVSVHNSAVADCQIGFLWTDSSGKQHLSDEDSTMSLGQARNASPGDLGVPDGSQVFLHMNVHIGKDNTSDQAFIYNKKCNWYAGYKFNGSTLINDLVFEGVRPTPS